MTKSHSDALVFFGATGDLAYKKIFPTLQAMIKRGHFQVGACSGFERIAADLSKQRPTVVAIVTPTPIGDAKEHPSNTQRHGRPPMRRQSS